MGRDDRGVAQAWAVYEQRWAELNAALGAGAPDPLTFAGVPWPVREAPRQADDLRPQAIKGFVLAAAHSPGVPKRERIRRALKRWHPDKFARVVDRVEDGEKEAVRAAAGVVVRCLNDMLEKENDAGERCQW
ncbi:hypothetical protein DENSPDRAFT_785529 [Dentipellis sp. KUC8613]|nr:hypothetical protein DENSPDRAFT_785529 [Dentipellis sp. KUC8613]